MGAVLESVKTTCIRTYRGPDGTCYYERTVYRQGGTTTPPPHHSEVVKYDDAPSPAPSDERREIRMPWDRDEDGEGEEEDETLPWSNWRNGGSRDLLASGLSSKDLHYLRRRGPDTQFGLTQAANSHRVTEKEKGNWRVRKDVFPKNNPKGRGAATVQQPRVAATASSKKRQLGDLLKETWK